MYSEMVKELNSEKPVSKVSAFIPREEGHRQVSKRDRAIEFARQIPKPVLKNNRSKTLHSGFRQVDSQGFLQPDSQLEMFEFRHQMFQRQLDSLQS